MKQLIVNADDFGRAPGVNRGILEAYEAGIVTSTTVMINYPDAAPGLEQALAKAQLEYEKHRARRINERSPVEDHYERAIRLLPKPESAEKGKT